MKRPRPSQLDDQQSSNKLWVDGRSADLYVSIRLVRNGVSSGEYVAEFTMSSRKLKKCSKYFEVCLSQRWENPNLSASSTDFDLEMIPGVEVGCYRDCFSRMDSPLRKDFKDFKDVKSSLELLRVASQIEFDKLISSICKYLSTILWSAEDELKIRQYSSSPDFPSSQAQDLLARLELGESQAKTRSLMQQCIKTALQCRTGCNLCPRENFASARSLLEIFFWTIGRSGSSAIDTDMVMIVSKEARAMLVDFHEECISGEGYDRDRKQFKVVHKVCRFVHKLEAVCWILKVLVRAKVADEVLDCFLLLEMYPKILAVAANRNNPSSSSYVDTIADFARIIYRIHREVVAGNVVVGTPARIALLERWNLLELLPGPIWKEIFRGWGYARAVEDVFSTLPFRLQMKLVRRRRFDYEGLISPNALATLMKRKLAGTEEDQALLEDEEEVGSSG